MRPGSDRTRSLPGLGLRLARQSWRWRHLRRRWLADRVALVRADRPATPGPGRRTRGPGPGRAGSGGRPAARGTRAASPPVPGPSREPRCGPSRCRPARRRTARRRPRGRARPGSARGQRQRQASRGECSSACSASVTGDGSADLSGARPSPGSRRRSSASAATASARAPSVACSHSR